MESTHESVPANNGITTAATSSSGRSATIALWVGRILSTLLVLMLGMGAVMDIIKSPMILKGMAEYGYPVNCAQGLGVALLVCIVLYAFKRTSILGAILLTGYLGGAVATHVHAGQGPKMFMDPVIFAAIVWGALYIRNERLRQLVPLMKSDK